MKDTAHIYIFRLDDGFSGQERLTLSTKDFLKREVSNGTPLEAPLETDRTEKGKPYFPGHPLLQFSVTHSGAYWLCALSQQPIGIDLQKYTKKSGESIDTAAERFCRMSSRFFHPDEAAYVNGSCKEQPLKAYKRFFRVWAAKESYVKFTGSGIDEAFNAFSILPGCETQNFFIHETSFDSDCTGICWQTQYASFQEVKFLQDYSLCICTKAPVSSLLHRPHSS